MLQVYSVTVGCFIEQSLNENLFKRGTSKFRINYSKYDNPVPKFLYRYCYFIKNIYGIYRFI
jgi:hypothetical protein